MRLFFVSNRYYVDIFFVVLYLDWFILCFILGFFLMYGWIVILSCIFSDIVDLIRVNLFMFFEFFLWFVILFFLILLIVIFFVAVIIVIHSCNPNCIVEDDSVSVLKLEIFKSLLVCHGFNSLDDDIGHWDFVNDVVGNQ